MDLFTNALFTNGILPFLLVFVLVFAVLQKTKVLGEGKSQIDALVALAIGLILIGVPQPRQFILDIIPWLAVALVVLLIVFLLYGFGAGDKDGLKMPDWFKRHSLWVILVFVALVILFITQGWDTVASWFDSSVVNNILVIVVIGVVLWVAIGKK